MYPPPIVAAGVITDSLGRDWDPNKHPRDRKGKFIHTNRLIRAFLTSDGTEPWATGEVAEINSNGTIRMKVNKVSDPAHNNYVGQLVDVPSSNIENINEKATLSLDIYGKPKLKQSDLGNYDFSPDSTKMFSDGISDDPSETAYIQNSIKSAAEALKTGKVGSISDRQKMFAAMYAKTQSGGGDGEGKKHSDDEYMKLLEDLGVPPDVIDDTPDGMSGLKWLMDQENESHSPNNNDKGSMEWFDYIPPTDQGVLMEARLKNSDVRVRWYADGSRAIVWPDGTVEQHQKQKGDLLLAAQGAHAQEGNAPDGTNPPMFEKNAEGQYINPNKGEPGLGHPGGLYMEEPTFDDVINDLENILDEPAFGESNSAVDPADINELADDIQGSDSEYADEFASSLRGIASGIEDNKLPDSEVKKQLGSLADEVGFEADDNEDSHLQDISARIQQQANLITETDDPWATDTPNVPEPTPEPDKPAVDKNGPFVAGDTTSDTRPTAAEGKSLLAYQQGAHNTINEYLRNGQEPNDFSKGHIENLDSLLDRTKTNKDVTVWRGLREDGNADADQFDAFYNALQKGAVVEDLGYVSTSRNFNKANDQFAFSGEGEQRAVLFNIEIPEGAHAVDVTETNTNLGVFTGMDEKEILLPRGTRLEILDVSHDETGRKTVKARITDAEPTAPLGSKDDTTVPAGVEEHPPDGPTGLDPKPDHGDTPDGSDGLPGGSSADGVKKFEVLPPDQQGKSGDGYTSNPGGPTLWGKYGASGVMVRHVDNDGTERFLLVQRGPALVGGNQWKWQLPGGAINEKESDYQGAARELTEELSPPDDFLGKLKPVGEVNFKHESGWHYNNLAADSPEQFDPHVDGHETGDAKWFTRDEIAKLTLHPALAKNIDQIFAQYPETDKKQQDTPNEVDTPPVEASWNEFTGKMGFTSGEQAALTLYGYAPGYKLINPYLHHDKHVFDTSVMAYRPATPQEQVKAEEAIKNLDSAFEKAKPLDHSVLVYRRTGPELFTEDDMTGKSFTNLAYTSTATKLTSHGYGYESKPVFWEITLPSGTKALQGNAHENEVLLPRDGEFDVTSDVTENGVRHLKVTYKHLDSPAVGEELPMEEEEKDKLGLPSESNPKPEPTPMPDWNNSEPGPGSSDFANMKDAGGEYRWHPSGVKLRIGMTVKSQKDGLEGEIVKFEKNHDGVVVKGTDNKKRGRKIKTLDVTGQVDGASTPPQEGHPPTTVVHVDGQNWEKNSDGEWVDNEAGEIISKDVNPTKWQELEDAKPVDTTVPKAATTPEAPPKSEVQDLEPSTWPGWEALHPDQQDEIEGFIEDFGYITPQGQSEPVATTIRHIIDDWDADIKSDESVGDDLRFLASKMQGKHDRERLKKVASTFDGLPWKDPEPDNTPLEGWEKDLLGVPDGVNKGTLDTDMLDNWQDQNILDQFMTDSTLNDGDFLKTPGGYELSYDKPNDRVGLFAPGANSESTALAWWSRSQYEDHFSMEDLVQDINHFVKQHKDTQKADADTANATPAHTVGELDGIRKSIPFGIGQVKKQFPGMNGYQVTQYRNAGYAMNDMLELEPESPQWNKAFQKAQANLKNAGPLAQNKLDELNNWHAGVTGKPAEKPNPVAPGDAPIGSVLKLKYSDTTYTKNADGNWVSSTNALVAEKGGSTHAIIEKKFKEQQEAANIGDAPVGSVVKYGTGAYTKNADGDWVSPGGAVVHQQPAGGGIHGLLETKFKAQEKDASIGAPLGATVQHGGGTWIKMTNGSWSSSYGGYAPQGSPIYNDLEKLTSGSGGQKAHLYNTDWAKTPDGVWTNDVGDVITSGDDLYDELDAAAAAQAPPKVTPGDPNVPVGATVAQYYGHDYTKGDNGDWTSPTGQTIHVGSDAEKDINWYAKDTTKTPPTLVTQTKPGKYLPDSKGDAIYVGSKVQSSTDGLIGTVVAFEKNGTGVIVLGDDGKKRARKAHKMYNLDADAAPHQVSPTMPDTDPSNGTPAINPSKINEPDPSSPWYNKPKPEQPAPLPAEDMGGPDQAWWDKVNAFYNERRKTQNPNWTDKPLETSATYSSYSPVKQGSISHLDALKSQGRISEELHADALKQIQEQSAIILEKQNKHAEDLKKWREDTKEWRKANGMPTLELRGMDDNVHKWGPTSNYAEMKAWMNKNQKAGSLGPNGHLSQAALSAVNAQKGANISGSLRPLKEKSLDPSEIDMIANASTIKGMDLAMQQSPPVAEDFMTIRTFATDAFIDPDTGMAFGVGTNISNIVGSIQHDWGFAETSPGSFDAGAEPGYNAGGGGVRMELRVPAGTRGVWTLTPGISQMDHERGFILERGIAYYIHSVEKKYGHWYVKAELIPKTEVDYDEYGNFVNQNPFFD